MEVYANDALCQKLEGVLRKDGKKSVIENGLLCRKVPTDQAIQVIVPEGYRRTLLYHEHCPTLAGHPGRRWMYNVLWRTYYWPHIASNLA